MNIFGSKPQPPANSAPEGDASAKLSDLLTLVESAVKRMDSVQTQVDSLNGRIDQVVSSTGAVAPAQQKPAEPETPTSRFAQLSDEQLEGLSRKELLALQQEDLLNIVTSAVKEIVDPINNRIGGLETNTVQSQMQSDLKSFINATAKDGKQKHPDWEAYAKDMRQIMETKKGLSFAEAYVLAKNRLQNNEPETFQKNEEKYFPKPEPANPLNSIEFGGLRPLNLASSAPSDNSMDVRDAAAESYKQLAEVHGPLPTLNG